MPRVKRKRTFGDFPISLRASPENARDEEAWYYRNVLTREECPKGYADADETGYKFAKRHPGEYCVRACDTWKPARRYNEETRMCDLVQKPKAVRKPRAASQKKNESEGKRELSDWNLYVRGVRAFLPEKLKTRMAGADDVRKNVFREISGGVGRENYIRLIRNKLDSTSGSEGRHFAEVFGNDAWNSTMKTIAGNVARLF